VNTSLHIQSTRSTSLILKSPLPHSQNPCLIPRTPASFPDSPASFPDPPASFPDPSVPFPGLPASTPRSKASLVPRRLRTPGYEARSKALFPEPWPHSKISLPCAQGSGHAVCSFCVMMPAVLCQSISDWMTSALSKGSTSTHLHPPPTQKKRVAKQPTKPEPVSHKHETTPLTAGK